MPTIFPFFVSAGIFRIFEKLKIPNLDQYESIIIRKDNSVIDGYYTVNIMNVLDCIDRKKTIYSELYGGDDFKNLVFDNNLIPANTKLFRLAQRRRIIVAHKDVKVLCEKNNVSRIVFIPLEEYTEEI